VRIDAHHHVWDLTVRDQPWTAPLPPLRRSFSLADLRPLLSEHDIDATILVQTVCVPEETPELLTVAAADPLVAGVVGWVDLTRPDVTSELARLRGVTGGRTLVGIRHQVQEEPDPAWLQRPDVRRGLQAVSDSNLVYDLLVRPHQLPAAVEAARSLPELRFVLDHAGKPVVGEPPSDGWASAMRSLGALPNVTVKLSGLTSEAPTDWTVELLRPFVEALLAAIGPDRLMFGSDWPVCLLGGGYDVTIESTELLLAELGAADRRLVFGEVAANVYGLSR